MNVGHSYGILTVFILTHIIDMIIDNDPPIERYISVPRDLNTLSCSSFTAGVVEAVLDGLGFVSLLHLYRNPLLIERSLHE
jgi:hypothetical protein